MRTVEYKGKTYKDIDIESQNAFKAMNIHTFRYFPEDGVWMASDTTAEKFGIKKFHDADSYENGPMLACKEDADKDRALYQSLLRDYEKDQVSSVLRDEEGRYFHITLAVLERNEDGKPTIIAGMIEDFDEEMVRNAYLTMLSDDYYSVIDIDLETNRLKPLKLLDYIDGKYGQVIGNCESYEYMITKYIDAEVHDDDKDEMRRVTDVKYLTEKLRDTNVYRHEYRVIRDEIPRHIRLKVVKLNEGSELRRMIFGFTEISRDAQERLEKLAYYDLVTFGNNYNCFIRLLESNKSNGYIISCDIKDFRLVNETCGVAMGDKVLRDADGIIKKATPAKGFYGRVNGDHFVIFVPAKKEEAIVKVIDKITDKFTSVVKNNDIPKISPYFGVAKWKPGNTLQTVLNQANFAKHRIKHEPDINYGFYRDEDNIRAIEEKKIEKAFDAAIENEEFEIWYQPKYSPVAKEMTGAEALVRWRGADGNLISPGKFIPVYEKNGMIRRLDEYVFNKVCKQQRQLIDELGRTVPISVNLSRVSLFYDGVVERYKAIAQSENVLPELVPIEITESAAISNSDIKELSDRFYAAGFPLQIDDFGVGYSSLSTLNMMKFDTLKLDKSLIDYIGAFGGDRLIKHTVALAKDMGLFVTAEGVENHDQVIFLNEIECDNIQGYFYSRPVPIDEFIKKLTEDKLSDKFVYQSGVSHTFSHIVESVRRKLSDAAVERINKNMAIQINVVGDAAGIFYIEIKNGKARIEPYEYYDRDVLLRVDAATIINIIKGIGTMENAVRTGRVECEGNWEIVKMFDKMIEK